MGLSRRFRTTTNAAVYLSVILICSAVSPVTPASAPPEENNEPAEARRAARDNTRFAIDLYARLKEEDGNLFFSPYSISTALAMTYAGARGETEEQMARALRFTLHRQELHSALAALGEKLEKVQTDGGFALNIANSLWPQEDYRFRQEYLDLVEKHYGAPVIPLDYGQAEAAAEAINAWVEDDTEGLIKDLIGPDALSKLTTLVLANAIYFKGDWSAQFDLEKTEDAPFYLSGEKTVKVPMMHQRNQFPYAETDGVQILEMPYEGENVSMLVFLPREKGNLGEIENMLTERPDRLQEWTRKLSRREVEVCFPRFKMEWGAHSLVAKLRDMGMQDAFSPGKADFSGMDGTRELFISDVLHKAFVEVDEKGTEAAAATAVILTRSTAFTPARLPVFRADHPFLFVIRENITGSLLFMGRLSKPEEGDTVDTADACKETGDGLEFVKESAGTQADTELGPSTYVTRDKTEWEEKIWAFITASRTPRPEAPEIDFEKHMVLTVFMGRRRTGGYGVRIESVREFDDRIEVHYSTFAPGPGELVTMAITSPYHYVVVPAAGEDKEVKFIRRSP